MLGGVITQTQYTMRLEWVSKMGVVSNRLKPNTSLHYNALHHTKPRDTTIPGTALHWTTLHYGGAPAEEPPA